MTQRSRPGPPGSSCLTCKRRHKKCDQRQPICERCEAGDFECLGYAHNETAKASTSRSATNTRRLVPKGSEGSSTSHSTSSVVQYESSRSENNTFPSDWPEHSLTTPSSHELISSSDLSISGFNGTRSPCDEMSPVSSQTRKVEEYLYLFATRSTFQNTDDPTSILHKIVNFQNRLPYSPLDPLKTFLRSQWFFDYILSETNKITDRWYFKPTNLRIKPFRSRLLRRLQTSDFTRWITLVGLAVILAFLKGEISQTSLHNFWLEYISGTLKRELMRDLVANEMQERRTEWLHISLLKAMVIHSSYIYQVLRSIAPIFLQVVFSDPTLWPSGCNATSVPLSNVLHLEAYQLAFFALMDCTCAMAFGLPQQIEYDTTTGPETPNASTHQWSHSTPNVFQLLLADINACRDKSPAARDWRDIEQCLLTWESRPGQHKFKESWMAIAWYAVQESWRLALLAYLYLAVCGAPSDDPRIQSRTKQILQVIGTVRRQGSSDSNVSFFIQYLIVGICARSEIQRKEVRDKLSAPNETKLWLLRASDFVPVLDHLWHGAAAGGRPIKWADYMHSREAMLPVVL